MHKNDVSQRGRDAARRDGFSTIQWSVAILLAGLTIWTWKVSDAASRESFQK